MKLIWIFIRIFVLYIAYKVKSYYHFKVNVYSVIKCINYIYLYYISRFTAYCKLSIIYNGMSNGRIYNVLPKNMWTPIVSEHFWIHTQLPCCLSFRRAKVYPTGSTYIVVIGRCTICNSQFKGVVEDKPSGNSRYL